MTIRHQVAGNGEGATVTDSGPIMERESARATEKVQFKDKEGSMTSFRHDEMTYDGKTLGVDMDMAGL